MVTDSNSGTNSSPCSPGVPVFFSLMSRVHSSHLSTVEAKLYLINISEILFFPPLAFWFHITRKMYSIFSSPAFQEGEESTFLKGSVCFTCVCSSVFAGVCLQNMCVYPSELCLILCSWVASVKWFYLNVKGLTGRNVFPVLPGEKNINSEVQRTAECRTFLAFLW